MHSKFSSFIAKRPTIILGSASKSRRAIMDELATLYKFSYTVKTADFDEKAIRHDDPQTLVLALGRAKAAAIIARHPGEPGFLITCDQVVVHQGRILEKPESPQQCREFIHGYSIAPASTVGSIVCTDLQTGKTVSMVDVCHIHFSPIPPSVVEELIEGELQRKSGFMPGSNATYK